MELDTLSLIGTMQRRRSWHKNMAITATEDGQIYIYNIHSGDKQPFYDHDKEHLKDDWEYVYFKNYPYDRQLVYTETPPQHSKMHKIFRSRAEL